MHVIAGCPTATFRGRLRTFVKNILPMCHKEFGPGTLYGHLDVSPPLHQCKGSENLML